MSFSVSRLFKALASLRCRRSVLSSAITVSHPVRSFSSDRITSFSATKSADAVEMKKNLSSIWAPNQSVPYNMKKEPNEMAVKAILRDFVGKLPLWDPNIYDESDTIYHDAELWKLLTSEQLKDLGVYYNPTPIPSKEDWRASWHQNGKPSWLGNIPTIADDGLSYTATINSYVEEGGKGGYGVIFLDNYVRPKVASVGVSSKAHFPLIYYHLQGIRSALQLAVNNGFDCNLALACLSEEAHKVFEDFIFSVSGCGNHLPKCDHSDPNEITCLACLGSSLLDVLDGYFELLFPIMKEILELCKKLKYFKFLEPEDPRYSGYMAMHQRTTEDMKQYYLLDDEAQLYEMVLKPDKFPEELVDTLYDEVFKGYRFLSMDILEERVNDASSGMSAVELFNSLRGMC